MKTRAAIARFGIFVLAATLAILPGAGAQSTQQHRAAKPQTKTESPAQAELTKRILEANTARNSDDPISVKRANERLIASALREMGNLRTIETLYPQAVELYRSSLDFEDSPETRADLAASELVVGRPDDAIQQAQQVLAVNSHSVRAYQTLGRAYSSKQDFPKAAEAFSQAAQLRPDIETFYSLAICWLSMNDVSGKEHGKAVFEQMKEMAGDSGSLHVLFGRAYRDAGMMPDAIAEFQRAIQIDPATPHAHYFLGLARLALNEWKPTPLAESEFEQEIRYYPKDFLANYLLGFLASTQRQYAVADKYLKIAAELDPKSPEPWLYMGLDAFDRGDDKAAEPLLLKAVDLTGKDEARSSYQIRRAYVDLGRILAKSGREQASEVYFAKARELQNKIMQETQQKVTSMVLSTGAGSMAAMVPLDKRQEIQQAPLVPGNADPFASVDPSVLAKTKLTEQQRTTAKFQDESLRLILGQSFSDLATAEAMQHNYPSALKHYLEAERWNPTIPDLAKNLGLCAFRSENYPEAIRGLSRALEEQPNAAPLRAMLGMAYFAADKYLDAVKTFVPLGTRGMQDPEAGYAWAVSLTKLGDTKQASEVLSQCESGKLSNDTLLLVAQLWTEIGDYQRAVDTTHRALQTDGSMPKAHYYAALADIHWEHWTDAANELHAELAIAPYDLDAKYHLGFVYLQQSRTDDAVKLFREVVSANPNYANAQYELGKVLLDRGQTDEAVTHLEAAVQLSPQSDYMHYQLQAAYRKESRTADADRELAVYRQLKAESRDRAAVAAHTAPPPNTP